MRRALLILSVSSIAAGASAGDILQTSADGTVVFRGSYGITAIEANELVYDGKDKLSQLIWQSSAISTFTGELSIDLDRLFIRATGTVGAGGDGYMRNYDWLSRDLPWTDRSTHPDTRLNHYLAGSIEAGREVFSVGDTAVSLAGGIKYTDVKWTAWGGSYVYSSGGFRDTKGRFPDGDKSISYRQQWSAPFLGVDLAHSSGPWTFSGAFQAGLAINGQGTDDHWMRALRFIDKVGPTPALMMSAAAEYEIRPNTAIFVSGAFDRIFRGRADTVVVDETSGGRTKFTDSAGADYMSATLSFGLRGKF